MSPLPRFYVLSDPVNRIDPDGQLVTTIVGGIVGAVGGAVGTIAQGGSTQQAVVNALIGGVVGALAGSGLPVIGTPIGAGIASAVADLAGQLLTRECGQAINVSSVIGAGLGGALGAKVGGMATQLPGFPTAGPLAQSVVSTVPGLGAGAVGLAGAGIGTATGF